MHVPDDKADALRKDVVAARNRVKAAIVTYSRSVDAPVRDKFAAALTGAVNRLETALGRFEDGPDPDAVAAAELQSKIDQAVHALEAPDAT